MRLVRFSHPFYRSTAPAFAATARSTWSGLENEIDRLFASAVSGPDGSDAGIHFPVDLYEDKDHTYVRAELPGVTREDITVEMAAGHLTLAATRKAPAAEGESFLFRRSVPIADQVQADKVTAAYENGVLTVTLPKREETKPKKINVAVK